MEHNNIFHEQQIDLVSELLLISNNTTTGSLPCCVLQQESIKYDSSDENGNENENDVGRGLFAPKILSYDSFGQCLKLHKEWLRNTIKNFTIRIRSENKNNIEVKKKNDQYDKDDDDDDDDIVVAYISNNSPDMLLSVLACTSSTLRPAIPALLNTRWTPTEMISSLKSTTDNINNRRRRRRQIYTIILHDNSTLLENAARHVSNGLMEMGMHNQHSTCCLSIPILSHTHMSSYTSPYPSISYPKSTVIDSGTSSSSSSSIVLQRRMQDYQETANKNDAVILFTSGTTGGSKGVRLSDRALLVQALAKNNEPCGYSTVTAMLATTVPLFHVGGLSSFISILLAKGRLIFPARGEYTNRHSSSSSNSFQVQDISKSLQDTFFPANTLVVTRLILIGGQSASDKILQQTRQTFPNARIVQTYACTEAASSLTFLSLNSSCSSNGTKPIAGDCVGIPPSHIQLRIYPQTSSPQNATAIAVAATAALEPILKPYELGLIATKGHHVMNGYWQRGNTINNTNNTSINNNNNNNNQWFMSNDLGFWDEQGRLYFGGRAKDVIRTGGETVMSQEVERVIQLHPKVIECAIFPRKDDRFGEIVACALVTKQHGNISINSIKEYITKKLFWENIEAQAYGTIWKYYTK
ncbi:acetyl-CoA synthetase-like protein [Fragilariopsis cylindrus CCMP1102]|uniref:Acetyl-CoA synthetase-like protein n=1 Tax=Fragilariopsis cylindrus CCMP1102 TaxID=635003 RepID=A0A1E7FWF2_9STRA|nr:acetyl-CoA synthetase-like protein [Fragilariopsis cylindrus CCMP1102]|eukprot:OEU22480.1 acetyl-CoA synthetase-like protein [Fragilariopsis cylindrus CCMP1102]